tara:strand:- start:1078 stop:1500 length:423 start_codon:yes stop_codon:yes gene_type:complete
MSDLPKNKTIILFDGECAMCNNYILFVAKNDSDDNFRFLSIQNKKVNELKKIYSICTNNISSIYIIHNNKIKRKSKAVIKIISMLKFPYNLLIVFYVIPNFLRDIIYDLVAKNRYRIFGKVNECSIVKKHVNLIQDKLID